MSVVCFFKKTILLSYLYLAELGLSAVWFFCSGGGYSPAAE